MTMRKSVARICLLASAICFIGGSTADAQPRKKKPAAPAAPVAPKSADVELDDPTPATGGNTPKVVDNSPPPQAGQMTEQAAQAKRLFDGEKWSEAALALDRVRK